MFLTFLSSRPYKFLFGFFIDIIIFSQVQRMDKRHEDTRDGAWGVHVREIMLRDKEKWDRVITFIQSVPHEKQPTLNGQ